MSYELKWHSHSAGCVLHLSLYNSLTLEEMEIINQEVMATIDKAEKKIAILIDISELASGYYTVDQLRNTQQYMDHRKVDAIVVIANNKLNRLISLLVFNLARRPFFQYDNLDAAYQRLAHRGFFVPRDGGYQNPGIGQKRHNLH